MTSSLPLQRPTTRILKDTVCPKGKRTSSDSFVELQKQYLEEIFIWKIIGLINIYIYVYTQIYIDVYIYKYTYIYTNM